ncbi:lipocalin-like domain-containing protein [Sphingomonas sp. HF-S4]|uniref:Lipocalin-like domain-containing protein n=1 Tax=Sphingomonas agrestis TaxID=3080540 RepID=A0ABU3YAV0_9SPHN|nr:lipocalin-like domain-containing protein [Sphingomonas sp. HF-S4]MDV3458288.1 lipocalin-like domain-containing protein [Sphingomonas sp. HF-S4]
MRRLAVPAIAAALALSAGVLQAEVEGPPANEVLGTWQMVSATLEENGEVHRPYGARPAGMLVFTSDMRFVEVLTDADTPRFASDKRGEGTDAENQRAMSSSIGFFGTYTVDKSGRFTGNRVEGATFPNWVGSVRGTRELSLIVRGDRMFETFTRPDGGALKAEFVRVSKPAQ